MEFGQGSGRDLISRRGVLALFGAIAAMRHAGAAEQAIMQPVSLDHVNIRGPDVAKTAQFYMALFDTPVGIARLSSRPTRVKHSPARALSSPGSAAQSPTRWWAHAQPIPSLNRSS
jgi:hypothetical protein